MAKRRKGGTGRQKANLGRTYNLHPSPDVDRRMVGWGHTRRYLHNQLVADRNLSMSLGKRPDDFRAVIDEQRSMYDWVEDFPSQAANETIKDTEHSYTAWLDEDLAAERPTFEKRGSRLRFRLPGQAVDVRHVDRKWSEVWVPKAGWVRFRRHRPLNGTVRSATFTYTPAGGWTVSFGVAAKTIEAPSNGKPGVGVDFGISCSAYLSDEDQPRLKPPSLTPGEQTRLTGLERRKARQVAWAKKHNRGRYSNRLRDTIRAIADLKARQARRNQDFTHKLTCDLTKNHGWVGSEDLRVKNLTATAKGTVENPGVNVAQKAGLNWGILDNTPGERHRQLAYKAPKHGSVHVPVNPANTSRQCPECGAVDPDNRPGCGREFACVNCGHQAHADEVAAVNIERRAAHKIAAGPAVYSTGRTGHKAGPSRRKAGGSVKRVALASSEAGRVESRAA